MGQCDACKREGVEVQRDHRIARSCGGTDDARNLHPLCLRCHRRKTHLELLLRMGAIERAHAEWFELAFPAPTPFAALDYAALWSYTTMRVPDEARR